MFQQKADEVCFVSKVDCRLKKASIAVDGCAAYLANVFFLQKIIFEPHQIRREGIEQVTELLLVTFIHCLWQLLMMVVVKMMMTMTTMMLMPRPVCDLGRWRREVPCHEIIAGGSARYQVVIGDIEL